MQIEMFLKIILWLLIAKVREESAEIEIVTLTGKLVYLRAVSVSRSQK